MTPLERVMARADSSGPVSEHRPDLGACWLWTGYVTPIGYGTLTFRGNSRLAHRVAYELLVGPIPDGLTLDHLCRVRHCVNPAHLEPVTLRVNVLRGTSFAAVNAAKTHCVNGHEFTSDNTYIKPDGCRDCRQCIRDRVRRYTERKVAA